MESLKPGQSIKFQYVKRHEDRGFYPPDVNYEVESQEGTVIKVRDLNAEKLQPKTVMYGPKVERSRYLLTVQTSDNKVKSFYSGRVFNIQVNRRKNFIRRLLGV
jgi:hypothetical protein